MPSTKVPVLLALLVAALCTANLPAADAGATKTHRKMLGVGMPQMPEMPTASFATAQAAATANAANLNTNFPRSDNGGGCYNCGQGKGPVHTPPSFTACQAAANAYASSGTYTTGNAYDDQTFAQTFARANADAQAGTAMFGSDMWKNRFINICAASASASAQSFTANSAPFSGSKG